MVGLRSHLKDFLSFVGDQKNMKSSSLSDFMKSSSLSELLVAIFLPFEWLYYKHRKIFWLLILMIFVVFFVSVFSRPINVNWG